MAQDDFDLRELKGAWDRATPRPDQEVRAAHLRLAQEGFERLHTAVPPTRPGIGARLRRLLGDLALPGAGAATAVAAVAFLMVTPAGQVLLRGPLPAGEADGALPQGALGKEADLEGLGARVGAAEDAVAEAVPSAEPAAPTAAESVVSEPDAAQAVGSLGQERPAQATGAPESEEAVTAQVAEGAPAPPLAEGGARRPSPAVEAQEATQSPASEGVPASESLREPSTDAPAEVASSNVAPAADEVGAAMTATENAATAPPAALAAAAPPDGEAAARAEASSYASADAVEANSVDGLIALPPPPTGMPADAAQATNTGSESLAAVRAALGTGMLPAPEAVDVQGLVQALAPGGAAGGGPLGATASVLPAPWDASQRLVVVAVENGAPMGGVEIALDGAAMVGGDVPLGDLGPGRTGVRVLLLDGDGPAGPVRLGWTDPGTGRQREAEVEVGAEAAPGVRLAAVVAGWALLLRDGEGSLGGWGFGEAAALAEAALGAEAAELMRLSEKAAR